jgi:glycosyltransferase involved in cell wall biosynthesis
MLAFLLAKPTQFDSPFFKWMHTHRKDVPFVVFYWKPVETSSDTDRETGASVTWGFNLLEGYPWQQADPKNMAFFGVQLRQSGIRYLVCNGWKEGFAPLIATAAKQGVRLGLRIDSVVWDKSPIEMRIRRLWLGRAYRPFSHFFSSGSLGDEYVRAMGYGEEKIRRWPYCVDVDFFAPGEEHSRQATAFKTKYGLDERPVVLAICKWIERENPLELLQAFVQLNDQGIQLVMIGDGLLRGQMETLRNEYPELSIIFPGYVAYNELPAWYALTRVFVHTANCEVWGVSMHEAIAAGCAVIGSTRVGSGYDLIQHGQNGFQYPLGNLPALVQCLQAALTLPPETIERTNKTILKDWNYAAMVKAFEGLV